MFFFFHCYVDKGCDVSFTYVSHLNNTIMNLIWLLKYKRFFPFVTM